MTIPYSSKVIMKEKRRAYNNVNWYQFSNAVQHRDNYHCLKCGKNKTETVLQTHHTIYKYDLEPWEYPLSDCITLCKGCHAKEHGLIQPSDGWTLISIDDLGARDGICEKSGCGNEIRYEHKIYHPNYGYISVGSTCVEYLTKEDQFISSEVLKVLKNISEFIYNSSWELKYTKNGKKYYVAIHNYHQIRIYGKENNYSFQLATKIKGEKWFKFGKFYRIRNKSLERVKELSFIALKGTLTDHAHEKEVLRNIYNRIK